MGRFLQVRVVCQTYDPEAVVAAWPTLYVLAFKMTDQDKPADIVDGPGGVTRGVRELCDALNDAYLFDDWSQELVAALEKPLARAKRARSQLEAALAERDPAAADQAGYDLEEALEACQKAAAPIV